MSHESVSVNSNVTIRCLDRYGKTTRLSQVHNKATYTMVRGLLRFLCGDFNRTKFNNYEAYVTNNEANTYIPAEIWFGNIGVVMTDRSTDAPKLSGIDTSQLKTPAFNEYKLQQPLDPNYFTSTFQIDTIDLTTSNDNNNSMGLVLRFYLSPGKLVGRANEDAGEAYVREYFIDSVVGADKGWVYWDPTARGGQGEYETLITEIGLYSGDCSLLARVLLDGEIVVDGEGGVSYADVNNPNNPVIQTDSTSLIIDWQINIASIGQNDNLVQILDL